MGNVGAVAAKGLLQSIIDELPIEGLEASITSGDIHALGHVAQRAESSKGVFTVVVTSLVVKVLNPSQDTRLHQSSMPGGYSGRSVDTQAITPTLKANDFPSMAESGWLTRSLEQAVPYGKGYPGAIQPAALKKSFLHLLDRMNDGPLDPSVALKYLLNRVNDIHRSPRLASFESNLTEGTSPSTAMEILNSHWQFDYEDPRGTARLPVLAVFACLTRFLEVNQLEQADSLAPLENHNSPDVRSEALGDIEVIDSSGKKSQAIEVKFQKKIRATDVRDMARKARGKGLVKYIALTDGGFESNQELDEAVRSFEESTGAHLILQDTISFLETLLLFSYPIEDFLELYLELTTKDRSLKFGHVEKLRSLLAELGSGVKETEKPELPPLPNRCIMKLWAKNPGDRKEKAQ